MLSPESRLAGLPLAVAFILSLPAGPTQAQGCSHRQTSNSFQPAMSPVPAMQCSGMMQMSQSQGMRMGPPAPQMSLLSTLTPMMCASRSGMSRSRPVPFPMMQTPVPQPTQQQPDLRQLQLIALRQQTWTQERQRIALQQQERRQEKLQRIEQLKALLERVTTVQRQLTLLDRPAQDGSLQATQLNDLQHEVNALQSQLSGVAKAPPALLEQMSALQDQMGS